MKIKDWPMVDRPREKLFHYGPSKLASSELLAVILGSGSGGLNAVELGRKILKSFSAEQLTQIAPAELKKFFGLGPARAACLCSCFELSRRLMTGKKQVLILSPEAVCRELKFLSGRKKEHFIVFYLDVQSQLIKREVISMGTLTANLVHPREVFEPAILNSAAQIIICHNHPSGRVEPSDEDIRITRRLTEAGRILGIEIIDHVIVSGENFFSFQKGGII